MKSKVLATLLVGLVLLTVLVVRPDTVLRIKSRLGLVSAEQTELTPFYYRVLKYHRRVSSNAPIAAVQFVGDSFIQGLCVTAVTHPAINFGIGGDTTLGMLHRIPQYPSLQWARAIVLAGGFNDLWRHSDSEITSNYRSILQKLPRKTPVVMNAVFPVDERVEPAFSGKNRRIDQLNSKLRVLCQADPRCQFVDITQALKDGRGNLAPKFQDGDGLHLGAQGNAVWIQALQQALAAI